MDRRIGHLVALAVGLTATAGANQFFGVTFPLALAVGLAVGALARLSMAYPGLLVYGHQPRPVARWVGVAAGFTVAASMLVLAGGVPGVGVGDRVALTVLVFCGVWAGVGFGIGMARANAAADRDEVNVTEETSVP